MQDLIRPFFTLALLAAATSSASCSSVGFGDPGPNALSSAEEEAGWRLLFDGETTAGWRGFKRQAMPAGWTVEDGALVRADAGGDIVTEETFADFVLELQWKISEGGNSGIFFHVSEDQDAVYRTGPEYQVLDNDRHRDGGDPSTSAAANYALHAPPDDYTRPVGEWNDARLEVRDGRVRHWLNGRLVVDYQLWSDEWKALVAASKFASMPRYGLERSGHIALQDHGDRVAYRDIRILPLD